MCRLRQSKQKVCVFKEFKVKKKEKEKQRRWNETKTTGESEPRSAVDIWFRWIILLTNNSLMVFMITLIKAFHRSGFTWNCVRGLTVLLWDDHFLICPLSLAPSLSACLFWKPPLPSFPITVGVGERSFLHTQGASLKSFISQTLCLPESQKLQQNSCTSYSAQLLLHKAARSTLSSVNWRADTSPKRYVMNKPFCSLVAFCSSLGLPADLIALGDRQGGDDVFLYRKELDYSNSDCISLVYFSNESRKKIYCMSSLRRSKKVKILKHANYDENDHLCICPSFEISASTTTHVNL